MTGRPTTTELATLKVLADPLSQDLLAVLHAAGGPRSTPQIGTVDLDERYAERTVRARLDDLATGGLVREAERQPVTRRASRPVGRPRHWTTTFAGVALLRVGEVMALSAVAACPRADPKASPRERMRVLAKVLRVLDDDVMLEVLRTLTGAPRDTRTIVAACGPRLAASERAVSRRLARLTGYGVLTEHRTPELHSRMEYRIQPGWHPLATIVLLTVYWEMLHRPASLAKRPWSSDLQTLLRAVAPAVRMPTALDGAVLRLTVVDADPGRVDTFLRVEGRRLRVLNASRAPLKVDLHAHGTSRAWIRALVRREVRGLRASGDLPLLGAAVLALDHVLVGPEGRTRLRAFFQRYSAALRSVAGG